MRSNNLRFMQSIVSMMLCFMQVAIDAADKKYAAVDNLAISIFLRTNQNDLSFDISSEVAKFAAPRQDSQSPVDFILGTTIIPQSWGEKVYDIVRSDVARKTNVLTCRFDTSYKKMVRKIRQSVFCAVPVALCGMSLYRKWFGSDDDDTTDALMGQVRLGLYTVGSLAIASLLRDMYRATKFKDTHFPMAEILVGNLNTMEIESRLNMPCIREQVRDVYFSLDRQMIEARVHYGPEDAHDTIFLFRKNENNNYDYIKNVSLVYHDLSAASHAVLRESRKYKDRVHSRKEMWKRPEISLPQPLNIDARNLWECSFVSHVSHEPEKYNRDFVEWTRKVRGLQKFKTGIELHQTERGMQLDVVSIQSTPPPQLDSEGTFLTDDATYTLKNLRSMSLPACCNSTTTHAVMKTCKSSYVVLDIDGMHVCCDLRATCSPELKILLQNIIQQGRFEDYVNKNSTYSLQIFPERRRNKIIENLRVFCNVKPAVYAVE